MGQSVRSSRAVREIAVLASFAALTVAMTWPWAAHLRDSVADPGDSYLNSWILWWDFHQAFHDPIHLFDANIFHPLRGTLAFSEHNFGIALPLFPLFALGVAPLTVHGIAVLLAFVLSGYGTFRLARTLTGSAAAAWIAGIGFAFAPFRFMHIGHVNYLWAAWIPLLIEALVLFARTPDRRRAAWLGTAFLFNGLSCIHWFILTLIPFAAIAAYLAVRMDRGARRDFFRRGALAVVAAGLLLAPFLVPYSIAAKRYGFVRSAQEAEVYSAHLADWLVPDGKVHPWYLGDRKGEFERTLFPGLLLLVLPAVAFFLEPLVPREAARGREGTPRPRLLRFLDVVSIVAFVLALLSSEAAPFRLVAWGHVLLRSSSASRALAVLAVSLLLRWSLAYPSAFGWCRERNLVESIRASRRSEAFLIGLLLSTLGFFGSLGMNFPFHRTLFDTISVFQAIRGPARWAMVADVGLALLAGIGAALLIDATRRRWPTQRAAPGAVGALLLFVMLLDQRVAPMSVYRGEPDPDALTLRLKGTPMRGGIVELPADVMSLCLYTLRAADHGRPIVTAYSGFEPPHVTRIRDLSAQRPVPQLLLDALEEADSSYLVVHASRMAAAERVALDEFASRGVAAGRLRFIRRFPPREDLYAVVKNEPAARAEMSSPFMAGAPGPEDASLLGSVDDPPTDALAHGRLFVRGWARASGEDLGVTITIDGEERKPATFLRTPRPDVCAVFPNLAPCGSAGWEARIAMEPGDEGPHEIVAIFRAKDGRVRHYPARKFAWAR